MTKVFVSGSRTLSRLNEELRRRFEQIIEKQFRVLIGDANGADKAVQAYLAKRGYENVQVFCSSGTCRNRLGPWEVISVKPPHNRRDFEFFAAKDAAMAQEADVGLMIWDGQSAGTIVNAARLVTAGKSVVVYVSPEKDFRTLKSHSDIEALLLSCTEEIRRRASQYITRHTGGPRQHAMF